MPISNFAPHSDADPDIFSAEPPRIDLLSHNVPAYRGFLRITNPPETIKSLGFIGTHPIMVRAPISPIGMDIAWIVTLSNQST
jgi:hypothetical protein